MNGSVVTNTVRYWEAAASTTWGRYISAHERRIIELALATDPPSRRALDVGCGGGRWTRLAVDGGWAVTAVDVDAEAVRECAARNPGERCVVVDPDDESLPVPDGSVSALLCIEVVAVTHAGWFPTEAARALAPGGQLVTVVWNRQSLRGLFAAAVARVRQGESHRHYQGTYPTWRRTLTEAGFAVEDEIGLCWFPFGRFSDSRLVPACVALERRLGLSRLPWLSPWVVVRASRTLGGTGTTGPVRAGTPAVVVQRVAVPDDDSRAEWDRLVARTPGTDVTQLSVWTRVRAGQRFVPLHLLARRDGVLVGGALVLLRRVRGVGSIAYVSYGPVADFTHGRAEVVDTLADALAALQVRMLFVQPPEGAEDVSRALVDRGFRPSAAEIAPTGSMRIDLSADEAALRSALSRRLRYWAGRWSDRGVTVRQGDERDVPLLVDLMDTAAEARGYPRPPRLDYVTTLFTELARTGNVALFIGEAHGVPVSADLVTMCGDTVRGKLCGFDRDGEGRRLSVPAAARWEIIRWARRSGYRWIDFGGLTEATVRDAIARGIRDDESWPSADRAKMAFGGAAFRYPSPVELIRPYPLRLAYDVARRSRLGRSLITRTRIALRSSGSAPRPWRPGPDHPETRP